MTQATKDATARACWKALMNYSQADMDGVFVTVSRQAIHECKEDYDTLRDHAEKMYTAALELADKAQVLRVNCGGQIQTHPTDKANLLQDMKALLAGEDMVADATAAFRKDFPKGDGQ